MMHAPDCPNHGRLVHDLALGRLDERSAIEAESVRLSCPSCAGWWRSELEAVAAVAVDEAVGSVFAAFQAPARSRVARWLPVAAAAALAAGAGVLWYQHGAVQAPGSTTPTGPLAQESFDGDRDGDGVIGIQDLGFTVKVEQAREEIFADNLDGGELAGWTTNT
jgi:hypothetical protein